MRNSLSRLLSLSAIVCFALSSAPARAETMLVNSDNVKTASVQNAELSQYKYNDNPLVADWKLCEFKKNTAYTFTNTTNVVITSITFEGIADDNSDEKEGKITISDGTNSVSSSKITWNGRLNSSLTSLNIDVSSLSFSQNSTFTITTTYNLGLRFTVTYAAITGSWVMDYSVSGSWKRLCFSQVGTSTEWRSTIFSLPDADQQFWVGPGSHADHSVTKKFVDDKTVNFTFIGLQSNPKATNYYPGEGALGYVRIYSNSESDNYYAAFEPTYQMAYGLDGDNWDFAPFHHVSGYEYETEIITIPSNFDTQTYKYYVGSKADGSTIFINGKSSIDNLKDVNNLTTPANVKGTKGVFHIWSNSPDQNWYCEFKQYWNIILKGEDESVLYEKAVYSNAVASEKSITIPTDIQPEKEHYTFVGWDRKKGSSTATIKGGESYGIYTTNDIFYPAYAANYYYILLNDDGSEFYHSEELLSTLSEAERTKTFYANTPTKEGYTFKGWTREKGSNKVNMSAKEDYTFWTANDTFYPVWEKNAEPELWQLQLTKDGEDNPAVYDFDVSAGNNTGTYTLSLSAGTTYDLKIKYGSTLFGLKGAQSKSESFVNFTLCECSDPIRINTPAYEGKYIFTINYSEANNIDNPTIQLSVTYPAAPVSDACNTITATSGYQNTFADKSVLYQIDSDGRKVTAGNTKFSATQINSDGTNGAALSAQRCLLQFPFEISKVVVYAYNSTVGRSLNKVSTSTNADKDSYTPLTPTITTEGSKDYVFTISFASNIAADTYIWLEFNKSLNIYQICYETLAFCATPTIALTAGCDEGSNMRKTFCTADENYASDFATWKNAGGWTATATVAGMQANEKCTIQWITQGTSNVVKEETFTYSQGTTSDGQTIFSSQYAPEGAGAYVVYATVSADGKTSAAANTTAQLRLQSPPDAPTLSANATDGSTIAQGTTITFTADASVSAFRWEQSKDGGTDWTTITGATSSIYEWNTGELTTGTYSFRVIATNSNVSGCNESVPSNSLSFTVQAIAEHVPLLSVRNDKSCAKDGGATITASHITTGSTLAWYKDGTLISGETSKSITVKESGNYHAVATYSGTEYASEPIAVTVYAAAAITDDLDKQYTVAAGKSVTLSVGMTGAISYQWYTCLDTLGNNPVKVSNATTRQLNFSVPLGTAEGTKYHYYVEGIGECGGSVLSSVTTVEVITLSYETCISGSTNYYDFLELTANPWSDSNNAFKLAGASSPLTIKAADGYYITKVEFDIFSSLKESSSTTETHAFAYQWGTDKANARTYETEVGKDQQTFTLSNADRGNTQLTLARNIDGTNVGEASRTRYITRCCVTVAPLCTEPTMSYSNSSVSRPYSTTAETPQSLSITDGLTATYTSSNPDIAEVDEETGEITYRAIGSTTISAYTAGDATYCEAAASYTLTVTKPDGSADFQASLSPTTATLDCGNNATLTATPAGAASYQWYKDGVLLSDATASTYDATAVGIYRVLITANGYAQWSNTATVSNSGTAAPIVTRLTPFHYYRDKCNYTSGNDNPLRHLFNVVSRGTDSGKKPWEITVWKTSKDGTDDREISNVSDWLYADPTDSRVVLMNLKNLAARGKSTNIVDAGDRLTITVRPLNGCNEYDADAAESIEVYVTDSATRAVAYIVSGGSGNTITYGGDFLTGYNPNDLLAMKGYASGKTSWSNDPDPLYHVLDTCSTYLPIPVNGYAPFNKYNYEPFDIILLTDFPKTDKNVNGQTGAPYLNDLAELVDSKPFLTLKAHMAKNGMDKWKALGFKATPLVPTSTQLKLDLICSQHTIFDRVYGDIKFPNTTDADGQLQLLEAGGYDSGKGLQGFMARDMVGFMNIATIPYRNGSSDTLLVACCERQTNLDARLMVLSINAQAMSQLNAIGGNTLLSMLDYLLIDDYARVEDCGCIFNNNSGDGKWSTTANWQNGKLPQRATTAHIHANCEVDKMDAVAGELKIWKEATLTIKANAALQVSDRIGYCDKENRLKIYPISSASTIRIQADANGAGTLIHSASPDWEVPATVAYYSIASGAPTDCKWQWMTTPIHDMQGVEQYFYGAWLYEWSNEEHQWNNYLRNGDKMRPFNGYSLTQKTYTTYTIAGNLVYAQDTTIALSYDTANEDGCNLIGNSWTAPINISGFDAENDFKNCEATIILFNTGLDPTGGGTVSESADNKEAGQYVSVPVSTASQFDKAIQVIPAMQTFQVNAKGEGASVQLRYNSLVRTYSSEGINRQPMRVAARNNYEGEGITDRLHIRVDGERFSDHVYIFRNADCTYGFDNGWDGTKMLGDERAVQLFAEQGENQWAVSTQPSLAGTQLGFYRGEDDTYTMYFDYEGSEVLYLYDNETQRYTLVESGATYTFSSFTYDLEHRFLLTDFNPETPSGPTTDIANIIVSGDQLSISHTGSEPLTISVYDAAGHTCLRLQTDTPMTAIPLPDTQGVYLIEVQSASARITQKVVR